MEVPTIKPGPKSTYDFASYIIGHEILIEPLKQSSFKSMLSNFNKPFKKEERHGYQYLQAGKKILARRIR